jgi:hypothetical protein
MMDLLTLSLCIKFIIMHLNHDALLHSGVAI